MPGAPHYIGTSVLEGFGPSMSSLERKGKYRRVYEGMRAVSCGARHLQRAGLWDSHKLLWPLGLPPSPVAGPGKEKSQAFWVPARP